MAEDRKRSAKSESLTIRLNPRTRFVLEFVARMRGQTITTVVERALEAAGETAVIRREQFGSDLTWKDFWDVSEGVRALKIAREPELFPTYEEEKRLEFAKRFSEYFFRDLECKEPHRVYVEVLWDRIDELVKIFDEKKKDDYFAAEKEVRGTISKASIKVPDSKSKVKDDIYMGKRVQQYDLDDDIPF